MIFLYVLLILNVVVPHQEVIMALRVQVAGVPLNVFNVAIPLTLLFGLFFRGRFDPIDTGKRNFLWMVLIAWFVTISVEIFVGAVRGAPLYMFLQELNWALKLPTGILCGYLLVRTMKHARHMVKLVMLLTGVVAVLVLMHFALGASLYAETGKAGEIRTMEYNFDTAAIVAIFLVYTSAVNRSFLSRPMMLVLLPASTFAVVATLTRSSTISMMLSILVAVIIIPKGRRIHAWLAMGKASVWLVLAAVVAVVVGSTMLEADVAGILTERYYGLVETGGSGRWKGALSELQLWMDSGIFFGRGLGVIRVDFASQMLEGAAGHNAYTKALATGGIFGLPGLLVPLWAALHVGRRMMRSFHPDIRAAGTMSAAAGFYMGIQSLLSGGMTGERAALFFGIILGMAIKCYRFEEDAYEVSDTLAPTDWNLAPAAWG